MQDRATLMDSILVHRVKHVLPSLMRENNIDMWILISREYNEDPVLKTMLPATWLSARRRTILVFYDQGPGNAIEALAISRCGISVQECLE